MATAPAAPGAMPQVSAVVQQLAGLQAAQGKPLSKQQEDTLNLHLSIMSTFANASQPALIQHAAALLRSFAGASPPPPLPSIPGLSTPAPAFAPLMPPPAPPAPAPARAPRMRKPSSKAAQAAAAAAMQREAAAAAAAAAGGPPAGAAEGAAAEGDPFLRALLSAYPLGAASQPLASLGASLAVPTPTQPAPGPRKAAPKRGKRKAATPPPAWDGGDAELAAIMAAHPPAAPKKKKARSKYKEMDEPTSLGDGWVAHPPSIIYYCPPPGMDPASPKIAAFDVDNTLLMTKSGNDWSKNADDWRPYNSRVGQVLRSYHAQGYRLVIFSNQGNIKSALGGKASENFRGKMSGALQIFGVPAVVIAATMNDDYRKPNDGMWEFLCSELSPQVQPDPAKSFYVGDASSHASPHGTTDADFAEEVGLRYRDVQEVFGPPELVTNPRPVQPIPTIVKNSVNADLVSQFQQLQREHSHSKWEALAFKKAAGLISQFPCRITNDERILQQVSDLKGIGKTCMSVIRRHVSGGSDW